MTSGRGKYFKFLSANFLQTRVGLLVVSILLQTRVYDLSSASFIGTQPVRNCNSY